MEMMEEAWKNGRHDLGLGVDPSYKSCWDHIIRGLEEAQENEDKENEFAPIDKSGGSGEPIQCTSETHILTMTPG